MKYINLFSDTLKKAQKRFKKACVSADIESSDSETRFIDINLSTLSSVIEPITSLEQFLNNNQLENVSFEEIGYSTAFLIHENSFSNMFL